MRRTHGNVYIFDDVDRGLVDILRVDPRASNRAMAEAVGVTDETVAARLRRMRETGAMSMTAVIDWAAAGYGVRAVARARFEGIATAEALKPLLDLDAVHAIAETTGAADAVIHLLARDTRALGQFVTERLRSLDGLSHLVVDVVTETCKQSVGISTLPMPEWSPTSFPETVIPLDDVDVKILAEVAAQGHQSNRELARRLDVSDGTIRARLARMEAAGLMRIVATVDPVTTGEVGAVAILFCILDGRADAALDRLVADPAVASVERCVGASDTALVVVGETLEELHAGFGRELRATPGVRSVEVAVVLDVPLHRAHLGRLL